MTTPADPAVADGTRDPIDVLVEQFLAQRRVQPALSAATFAHAHPEHTAALLDVLPTILALEQHKRDRATSGTGGRRLAVPRLERLGEFRIVREVGRGGMGVVFEAVQEPLGRKVALKVLPQASLLAGTQLERFRREARIAAQLHHSNIVPVFGSGESDGYHWYAMQFIAGESLDRWREAQAAPPAGSGAWRDRTRLVARLGVQAASALHHAHAAGTLHRDVKPGNLLLEPGDHLWVTDFGLAKALEGDGLTHSGDLLGTLQYMAPEQFAGAYDARSEVYALGVTLYELLTLQPAFTAGSRSELMERIRTQRPAPLRRVCPDVPEDLVVVVEKACAREPADRYPDAGALQRDLQAFLDDRPVAARRLSPVGVVWRWGRRNRGMAALAASTLLALVAAGVTGWVAYGVTDDALGRERAAQTLAANNLQLALTRFSDVFDALIGRDPMLALDEDPETGEQTVRARSIVDPASVPLQQLLGFYQAFAAQNTDNRTLRLETARAHRRVGAVLVRLGQPEQLAAARAAFAQALALLDQVDDRNVARDRAAVLVEIGRLELQLRDRGEAERAYRDALAQLDLDPAPDTSTVRFEKAHAHLLLAQLADFTTGGGGGGGRPSGPGGGTAGGAAASGGAAPGAVANGRRELGRLMQTGRQHLQQATALATTLVAENAANNEFRLLEARCLLLASRLPDGTGRRGDRIADPQRDRAIVMLRELVAATPDAQHVRFELADALLGARPRERRRTEAATADAVDAARAERHQEGREHAQWLVAREPDVRQYQALLARAALQAARDLRERLDDVADAERAGVRKRMIAELELAVAAGQRALAPATSSPPEHVRALVEAQRSLALAYHADGRSDEAGTIALGLVELLEQQVAFAAARRGPGAPSPPFLSFGDGGELGRVEQLLQTVGGDEALARLQRVRDRWRELSPPRQPGPRPQEPGRATTPGEPRRVR